MDTRAFWVDSLNQVESYTEVDVQSMNELKAKKLDEAEAKALCERKVISMDFKKESTKDMPNHGFDPSLPTCWILEGLVMYLENAEVKTLLNEITGLSAKGSYLILDYFNQPAEEPKKSKVMSEILTG